MPRILCLASYFKGQRFLQRARAEGWDVVLLTTESLLSEPWPCESITEVFALPSFHDRRAVVNGVTYLARTRVFDRVVALDDFDVELAGFLRDHFQTVPGLKESEARLFRDKLAMRTKARELGVRIPEFCPILHHDHVRDFLTRVPGPWLVKPRSQASAAGIKRLAHADQVWQAVDALGDEQSFYLIERMVPGDVYHVDSLVKDGEVVFAEANGYLRPLLDVYHDGGIYATRTLPRGSPEAAGLKRVNERLLTGFGLRFSASHTEFLKATADGEFYFIETSARVGGANTAEMVEAATGVNLWSEWAKLEIEREQYRLPPTHARFGGVVISLARQERPDTSPFADPEIVHRMTEKNHIGFVVASERPERVGELLADYTGRIARDHTAVLPAAERVSH